MRQSPGALAILAFLLNFFSHPSFQHCSPSHWLFTLLVFLKTQKGAPYLLTKVGVLYVL